MARHRPFLAILFGSALVLPFVPGRAAQLTNLYHTGTDNSGNLVSNTLADLHYSLITSPDISWPGPVAYVVAPAAPWVVNGPVSKWISPSPSGGSEFRAVGYYTYRTQFDLTGYDSCSCVITGNWASDDETIDIYINGLSTSNTLTGLSTFDILHPLTITNGFISGTNTVDFLVHNGGFQTGLRAELFGFADLGEGAHMRVTAIQTNGSDVQVSFTTCSNRTYRIDKRDELPAGSWVTLTNGITGTGGIVTIPDVGAATTLTQRFYRAVLVLP